MFFRLSRFATRRVHPGTWRDAREGFDPHQKWQIGGPALPGEHLGHVAVGHLKRLSQFGLAQLAALAPRVEKVSS